MAISKTIRPYIVVFSSALFFLFEFINMNSFDTLNAALRQAFHADALQISNLSAMYFYANVLFLIPAGLLLDRISTKRLLQIALCFCILGNVVFANTDSLTVAKICRFVIGMGSTLVLLTPALLTSRWVPAKHAGLTMGLVVTMAMLGGSIAQQLPYLVNYFGSWRYAIMAIAFVGVIFLIIISIFVQDYPEDFTANHTHDMQLIATGFLKNLFLALRNKQVWLAGLYTSFINLTVMIIGALWGSEYLQITHQIPATQAGFIITFVFIGLIIGSPLFGLISDYLCRRKTVMIIGGILNIVTIIIILQLKLSYPGLIIAFLLLGIFSSSQILTYPLIMESAPSHIIASSESLSAALIMGGGALFQPLFGLIIDHFSQNSTQYSPEAFQHAMWILPITFLIATLLACLLKETYCKRIGA